MSVITETWRKIAGVPFVEDRIHGGTLCWNVIWLSVCGFSKEKSYWSLSVRRGIMMLVAGCMKLWEPSGIGTFCG
jgi:hypothetical protein